MLEITKLLKSFWGEDLSTTCYVQNKSFTSTMLRKTPYECWSSRKPYITHFCIFGCVEYEHVLGEKC